MTAFEIILLVIIYMFCYGYTVAIVIKEESIWLRLFLVIMSFALALCAPVFIGGVVFEKLNNRNQ